MSGWLLGRPLVDPDAGLERDERTGGGREWVWSGGCGWETDSGWCFMGKNGNSYTYSAMVRNTFTDVTE